MVEESKATNSEPQEDLLLQSVDLYSSMISEKKVELADGPKKCSTNGEKVQKLSVVVFTKLGKI